MASRLSWLERGSDKAKVVGLISIWVSVSFEAGVQVFKEFSTSQHTEPQVP